MANLPVEGNGLRKRLESLGQKHDALVQELNSVLNQLNRQVSVASEVINALSKIVGEDEVKTVMEVTREEQRKAAEEQQIKSLELLKGKDVLKVAESITDTAIVVTSETAPNNAARRHQFHMGEVQDKPLKDQFLGKKVGDTFEASGVKVEVKEIYLYDQDRASELMKEEAAKAEAAKTTPPTE